MDLRYAHKSDLKLSEMFFNPDRLYEPTMIDDLFRGIATTSMETLDQVFTTVYYEEIFFPPPIALFPIAISPLLLVDR
jgi:hypothetical protein